MMRRACGLEFLFGFLQRLHGAARATRSPHSSRTSSRSRLRISSASICDTPSSRLRTLFESARIASRACFTAARLAVEPLLPLLQLVIEQRQRFLVRADLAQSHVAARSSRRSNSPVQLRTLLPEFQPLPSVSSPPPPPLPHVGRPRSVPPACSLRCAACGAAAPHDPENRRTPPPTTNAAGSDQSNRRRSRRSESEVGGAYCRQGTRTHWRRRPQLKPFPAAFSTGLPYHAGSGLLKSRQRLRQHRLHAGQRRRLTICRARLRQHIGPPVRSRHAPPGSTRPCQDSAPRASRPPRLAADEPIRHQLRRRRPVRPRAVATSRRTRGTVAITEPRRRAARTTEPHPASPPPLDHPCPTRAKLRPVDRRPVLVHSTPPTQTPAAPDRLAASRIVLPRKPRIRRGRISRSTAVTSAPRRPIHSVPIEVGDFAPGFFPSAAATHTRAAPWRRSRQPAPEHHLRPGHRRPPIPSPSTR